MTAAAIPPPCEYRVRLSCGFFTTRMMGDLPLERWNALVTALHDAEFFEATLESRPRKYFLEVPPA